MCFNFFYIPWQFTDNIQETLCFNFCCIPWQFTDNIQETMNFRLFYIFREQKRKQSVYFFLVFRSNVLIFLTYFQIQCILISIKILVKDQEKYALIMPYGYTKSLNFLNTCQETAFNYVLTSTNHNTAYAITVNCVKYYKVSLWLFWESSFIFAGSSNNI